MEDMYETWHQYLGQRSISRLTQQSVMSTAIVKERSITSAVDKYKFNYVFRSLIRDVGTLVKSSQIGAKGGSKKEHTGLDSVVCW